MSRQSSRRTTAVVICSAGRAGTNHSYNFCDINMDCRSAHSLGCEVGEFTQRDKWKHTYGPICSRPTRHCDVPWKFTVCNSENLSAVDTARQRAELIAGLAHAEAKIDFGGHQRSCSVR
jgi:hypothetical protein